MELSGSSCGRRACRQRLLPAHLRPVGVHRVPGPAACSACRARRRRCCRFSLRSCWYGLAHAELHLPRVLSPHCPPSASAVDHPRRRAVRLARRWSRSTASRASRRTLTTLALCVYRADGRVRLGVHGGSWLSPHWWCQSARGRGWRCAVARRSCSRSSPSLGLAATPVIAYRISNGATGGHATQARGLRTEQHEHHPTGAAGRGLAHRERDPHPGEVPPGGHPVPGTDANWPHRLLSDSSWLGLAAPVPGRNGRAKTGDRRQPAEEPRRLKIPTLVLATNAVRPVGVDRRPAVAHDPRLGADCALHRLLRLGRGGPAAGTAATGARVGGGVSRCSASAAALARSSFAGSSTRRRCARSPASSTGERRAEDRRSHRAQIEGDPGR